MSASDAVGERLAVLETAEATRALLADYALAVDARDVDGLRHVFAREAVLSSPSRRRDGIDEIVKYFQDEFAANACARRHFLTTVRLKDVTPSSSSARSYFILTTGSAGRSILGWGRYDDRIERVDHELRIVEKHVTIDHQGPIGEGWADQLAAQVAAR